MKVLWFTNTPSGYLEKFEGKETISGGWYASLEKNLIKNNNISLAVAFIGNDSRKIKIGNITYYSISPGNSLLSLFERKFNIHNETKYMNKYLKVINNFKPAVIHIWGTEHNYGLLTKYTNIPTVIHLQGILKVYFHKWFNSNLTQFKVLCKSSLKNVLFKRGAFWRYYIFKKNKKRESIIFNNCKYFIGRTDWDRRVSRILSPNSKYFHNDEMLRDIFYHNKWTYQKNKKTTLITTIGGTTYKGLETIFNTLSIIILKLNINIEWKIIGIDNNHEIVKIMKRFTKVNVSSLPINFLGIKNAKELITEMLNSDIFIHPSHIDNSPNSVCEAMILGMPVIATYAGGTGSLLIDQKEGVLIQDGDPYAMAGAIIELIENIELAKKYGKNARKRAMKRHNKEKIVNKLVQIYRDINSKNK